MTLQAIGTEAAGYNQIFANASNQNATRQLDSARASLENSRGSNNAAARDAAEQFEAVFISQFLAPIFNTIPTDGPFGGGHAEGIYRNLMVEQIGTTIAKNGGFGIAESVFGEILKLQEAAGVPNAA